MKKISLGLMIMSITMLLPTVVYANMAAPEESDIGSAVTFEKNEEIAVLSEVLDIVVSGSQAEITATYTMKNTTDREVTTQSMFLSPNIEQGGTEVLVNGVSVEFVSESFELNYDTEITTNDWEYIVLTDEEIGMTEEVSVDTVTFEMEFEPQEKYEVVVSYTYNLGGYPDYDYDAKRGEITYYLAPAAMWKDFENLTINLVLDKDMPIIAESNLEFEKVDTRTYQYVSDTLPVENLQITIDENWFQNIFSTIRSPYMPLLAMVCSPIVIIAIGIIGFIVWFTRKGRGKE